MVGEVKVFSTYAKTKGAGLVGNATGVATGSFEMGKTLADPGSGRSATVSSGVALAGAAIGFASNRIGNGMGVLSIGIKVGSEDTIGDGVGKISVGDVLGTAAMVASLFPGGQLLALGLTVAGFGYTVWTVTGNDGKDVTIKDLIRMHPDNFRKDDWGSDPAYWKEFQDQNRDGKFQPPKDPLVLDLDGDGIETVKTDGYQGAMFDHDKDGIQVATGWVAADDGLLVIDKNGDGLINNGGELFGDNQVLKDGTLATTGYAALADYDSNGDKVIDSKDAEFADLRVWRDLNQDGISQSNELFTLAQLNIQSLDLEHQNVDKHLGNGKDDTKNACLKTLLVA